MSVQQRGNFLTASPPSFSTTSTGGIFTLNDAATLRAATQWPRGPVAPTSLTATAGNGQLSLTWTAPATPHGTITNYFVEYTASGGSAQYVLTNSTSTSYTLTGLTNGTSYTVRVAAVNFTAGDWSGTAIRTPAANIDVQYLVIAGGGSGGNVPEDAGSGGGGGAGRGAVQAEGARTAALAAEEAIVMMAADCLVG